MNTDCNYSFVIDPSTYDTRGLCPGMEARVHNDHLDTDLSVIGALEDWRELIGPASPVYKGGLGHPYNSIPISIPECMPDRLNIVTYATEFAFLQDDAYEGGFEETEFGSAISQAERTNTKGLPSTKNARKIQAWIISKILSIDPVRGKLALNAWKSFYESNKITGLAAKEVRETFLTLESYFRYRLEDLGCQYWTGMLIFACGLDIPEHEMPLCRDMCRPGWVAFTLVNDVCSFDKEVRDAKKNGNDWMSNAIWVVVQERGIPIEEARKVGAQMLNDAAAEFIEIMKEAKASGKYSHDFLRFLDGVYWSISGSLVWSVSCPRHNAAQGARFNNRQLDWMKNGIPDHLRRGDSMKSAAYQLQTGMQVKGLVNDFSFDMENMSQHQRKLAMYVEMGGLLGTCGKLKTWQTRLLSGSMTVLGVLASVRLFYQNRN
ncbi:isoprenoid synthase domain-containing protein [Cercophora newfieldiana]|uniref:Isoprenoid synthase domain-containing protein n=1 Tax=Cercophora newfieldiana TaxID=92897 RepID=A0AA39Y0Q6_9PEZI|nr:isoprenoid synthase domain-containing protein [Cercophora newfieldiana]